MKKYLDEVGLQDFATKLTQKYKSIFAARGEAGTPIPVETVAEMTDTDQIYVYTGTETGYTAGDWYYYDGSAWVSGGSYGAGVTDDTLTIEGRAADAKATGDAIHATQSMIAPREASSTATRNYSVGDLVIVGDVLYRVTAAIASGETITPGTNVTADTVAAELAELDDEKADKDGTILNAENAEQIVTDMRVTNKVPYTFRTAGGGLEVGDRAYIDKIVGGTVAWNQRVQNGNFADTSGWSAVGGTVAAATNILTVTVGSGVTSSSRIQQTSAIPSLVGHKILFCAEVYCDKATSIRFGGSTASAGDYGLNGVDVDVGAWKRIEQIGNVASGNTVNSLYIYFNTNSALSQNDTVQFKNVCAFDLTQMFGATIADYIAALETANAGAGVAWFKALFPNDYYAYDTGTLRSVNAAAHKTVGFNAFDPTAGTAHVLGGMQYQITGAYTALSLGGETITPNANGKFTPSADGVLTVTGGGATTCIHLDFGGERDGEYEPYSAHTYALDDTLTLRGIPKLDANNALYYDGDEYAPDGNVDRNYSLIELDGVTTGKKFQGSWATQSEDGGYVYYIVVNGAERTEYALCDRFALNIVLPEASHIGEFGINQGAKTTWNFVLPATEDTLEKANTWLQSHPTHFIAKKVTPTTEAAAPYTSPQIVDNFGTEEYTDAGVAAGTRDVAIPVGHETGYPVDLRAKLEAAPDSPDADGDYIMRRTSGVNAYAVLTKELPSVPGEDGTYVLKCTVSGGTATLSWVSES